MCGFVRARMTLTIVRYTTLLFCGTRDKEVYIFPETQYVRWGSSGIARAVEKLKSHKARDLGIIHGRQAEESTGEKEGQIQASERRRSLDTIGWRYNSA